MKKISVISIILLLFGFTAVGMLSGYYIGLKNISEKPNLQIEDTNNNKNMSGKIGIDDSDVDDKEEYETGLVNEEHIGPNTMIEYRTYYTECNHETVETTEPEKNMINMTKDNFKEFIINNHPKWKIDFFSHDKIVIITEKKHLCQNHYVIGEKDGKIAVFRIDDKGERILDKIYNDAPISLLKEIDQEKIMKGIITDNKEELSDILEDYIS